MQKPWHLHYYSASRDGLGVKRSSMIHLSSSNWFGPLFSSQNWTNSENIPKNSNFSMDFDNFCSFFECHSILAEKQRTKQTNYSSLSLSTSLDTQDTLQGGIIVEWKKFWQEIPVCSKSNNFEDPLIMTHSTSMQCTVHFFSTLVEMNKRLVTYGQFGILYDFIIPPIWIVQLSWAESSMKAWIFSESSS